LHPYLKGDTFRTSIVIWYCQVKEIPGSFPVYDEENIPIDSFLYEEEYYSEKTFGENVPISSDPKVIELKQSIFPLGVIRFDLEENKKYRVDVKYKTGYSNDEDERFIDIQSNLFSFVFFHEVFDYT